jgi:glyoxylase-like metal-dependent hydrolase (beta-lactamase superfamily II)
MPKLLKRILIGVGALVAVLVAMVVSVYVYAFGSNSPIPDSLDLTPTARLLKDGFVDLTVLDLQNGTVALIDSGNDVAGKVVLAELTRRHLGPEAVAAIFVTHGHGDHINGCHAFPRAEVYAMAADVGLVEGTAGPKGFLTSKFGKNPPGLHVGHPLHDGETVVLGNRRIQAFATPGHTGGSAVYLVDGILYFGDTAGADKQGHLKPAVGLFSDDPAENVASLKALAARLQPQAASVKTLVFAHTGPLQGLDPLLQFAANPG